MEVLNQAVKREGFGAKFVDGPKVFVETLGAEKGIVEELRNKIIDMKGGGAVMHDHRGAWSAFFCEMTAGYGASTQGRGTDTFLRRDLGYDRVTPGVATNLDEAVGKVEGVYRTQIVKLFWDSLGICTFGTMGVAGSVGFTSKSVAKTVGWDDFDEAEAFTVGERISNLLRLVYARRGFKREDELDLSPRFLEITRFGPAEKEGIAPYLPAMLDEYYRYQGWDVATGTPTAETLTPPRHGRIPRRCSLTGHGTASADRLHRVTGSRWGERDVRIRRWGLDLPAGIHALLTLQFAALGAAPGHTEFDQHVVEGKATIPGDFFHYLHHRYFECNYGSTTVPFDRWLGTFRDGSPEAHADDAAGA